jgi:hypothetical protein
VRVRRDRRIRGPHEKAPSPLSGVVGYVVRTMENVAMARVETIAVRTALARASLLIYFGRSTRRDLLAPLAGSAGGFVLCGDAGVIAAQVLAGCAFDGPLLIDPAQYDPQEPVKGRLEPPDAYWLSVQRENMVSAYLSPSEGYLDRRDPRMIRSILRSGDRFARLATSNGVMEPVFTVLPVSGQVLAREVPWLIQAVAVSDTPVALVLGDANNPMDRPGAVEGLVRLLREVPTTSVLRTDLSGIAAVANGAWFGAIGTTSSARHLVPPGQRPGGSRGDPTTSIAVPSLASFRRGSLLERLEASEDLLGCGCAACGGASLCRFGDPRLRSEGVLHSAFSTANTAAMLLRYSPADRAAVWARLCLSALDAVAEIEQRTGVPIPFHAYVRAWAAFA